MNYPKGTRTTYAQCSTTKPLGHSFKRLLKGKAIAGTAPLFSNLHRGSYHSPIAICFGPAIERGLPTPVGPLRTYGFDRVNDNLGRDSSVEERL